MLTSLSHLNALVWLIYSGFFFNSWSLDSGSASFIGYDKKGLSQDYSFYIQPCTTCGAEFQNVNKIILHIYHVLFNFTHRISTHCNLSAQNFCIVDKHLWHEKRCSLVQRHILLFEWCGFFFFFWSTNICILLVLLQTEHISQICGQLNNFQVERSSEERAKKKKIWPTRKWNFEPTHPSRTTEICPLEVGILPQGTKQDWFYFTLDSNSLRKVVHQEQRKNFMGLVKLEWFQKLLKNNNTKKMPEDCCSNKCMVQFFFPLHQ